MRRGDVLALEAASCPRVGLSMPRDRAQRGGLARAVRADERHHLALCATSSETPAQRLDGAVVDVAGPSPRRTGSARPSSPRAPPARSRSASPRGTRRPGTPRSPSGPCGPPPACRRAMVTPWSSTVICSRDAHHQPHVVLDDAGSASPNWSRSSRMSCIRSAFSAAFMPAAGSSRQQHLGLGGERAGDLQPALLAVRQVPRAARRAGAASPITLEVARSARASDVAPPRRGSAAVRRNSASQKPAARAVRGRRSARCRAR